MRSHEESDDAGTRLPATVSSGVDPLVDVMRKPLTITNAIVKNQTAWHDQAA